MAIQLADLDYYHLNKELNMKLTNSRINKIYQVGEGLFKINFNTQSEGKISMVILLPDYLTLTTRTIVTPDQPSSFTMNLRKYLDNARVISIEQPALERILVFNMYAQGNEIKLIFEMFSNGNVLLVDSSNKILFTYRRESWKDREVKRGVEYILPPAKKSCFEISETDFELNGKKTLMAGILSTVSLAPKYLEQAIISCGEDPKSEITYSISSIEKIIEKIKSYEKLNTFYVYETPKGKELSLIKIDKNSEFEFKEFNSISEAIDYAFEPVIVVKESKVKEDKSSKVEEHLRKQLEENKNEMEETIKKGEFIFENYNKIEYVLNYVNSLVEKGKSEKEINSILEKNNMSVDLKEKKVKIKIKL